MGLYGMMRTSASGMAAQANRLGTVADNIANSSTTGYKRASTEFTSLILDSGGSEYVSGGVETRIRHSISEQGAFKFTTSVTDLAVKGSGFFIVSGNEADQTFFTRAGSFVPDGDGNLVNAAGYKLMGYSLADGNPNVVTNGTAGLTVVNLGTLALQANPSTLGELFVNLPANAAVTAPADLPSANAPTSTYSGKTSLVCGRADAVLRVEVLLHELGPQGGGRRAAWPTSMNMFMPAHQKNDRRGANWSTDMPGGSTPARTYSIPSASV